MWTRYDNFLTESGTLFLFFVRGQTYALEMDNVTIFILIFSFFYVLTILPLPQLIYLIYDLWDGWHDPQAFESNLYVCDVLSIL